MAGAGSEGGPADPAGSGSADASSAAAGSAASAGGDLPLLRLLQLHDSQFPVGAFAHSNGLETYAQEGLDDRGLHELLAAQVEHGWGRLELAAAALAWSAAGDGRSRAGADGGEVSSAATHGAEPSTAAAHHGADGAEPSTVRATVPMAASPLAALEGLALEVEAWKPIPGLRSTSLRLGRRMLTLALRLWPEEAGALEGLERPHHAVVVGALARRLRVPLRPTLLAFAQGTLWSALTAATRCMPLSPERAQELVVALQPAVAGAVERVLEDPGANLWSATPAADLRAHQQAGLYTRLFQS